MRTAAVLPVKSFVRAKQRLDSAVGHPQRTDLAAAMVEDVLAALNQVDDLDEVLVVTAESRLAAAAGAVGALVVHDPDEAGQSAAAALGVAAAVERGAERVLLVPGDCPTLDPGEVDQVLRGFPDAGVVIVPDRHGSGTNALRLAPPDVIWPAFGHGSFARHAARGAGVGAAVRIAPAPSLELDVDTPGDLEALRAALARFPAAAPRTRAVLDRLVAASARA
jgi:2-phospho-L-lactate guanylyltransferase